MVKRLKWITIFYWKETESTFRVNSSYSACSTIDSGSPQGSIFGHTLFIIYINELPENVA